LKMLRLSLSGRTKIGLAGDIISKGRQRLIRIAFRITTLRATSVQK